MTYYFFQNLGSKIRRDIFHAKLSNKNKRHYNYSNLAKKNLSTLEEIEK